MPEKAVSIDVWNTVLDLKGFYVALAKGFSEVLGIDEEEALLRLSEARATIKQLRAEERIRPEIVVEQCIGILSEKMKTSPEVLKRCLARVISEFDSTEILYEDAVPMLEELFSEGIHTVMLSNVMFWPGFATRMLVERAGLGPLVTAQLYADEIRVLKPSPLSFSMVSEVLRRMGIEADILAHIGDDFREDFLGALNAGVVAILVDRKGNYERGEYFRGRGYVVGNLREATKIILSRL